MICSSCNNEIKDDSKYCSFCGKLISEEFDKNNQKTIVDDIEEDREKKDKRTMIIIFASFISLIVLFSVYYILTAPLNEAKGYLDTYIRCSQNMDEYRLKIDTETDGETLERYETHYAVNERLSEMAKTNLEESMESLNSWQLNQLKKYMSRKIRLTM